MINFCPTESEVDELIEELLNPVRNERDREKETERDTCTCSFTIFLIH